MLGLFFFCFGAVVWEFVCFGVVVVLGLRADGFNVHRYRNRHTSEVQGLGLTRLNFTWTPKSW